MIHHWEIYGDLGTLGDILARRMNFDSHLRIIFRIRSYAFKMNFTCAWGILTTLYPLLALYVSTMHLTQVCDDFHTINFLSA